MGLFDFLKKKGIMIGTPVAGDCVPLSQVNDPTFSEEILGKGIAVIPENGLVYAPADGEVSTVFPTGHAVALTTPEGVEILIHIGLDTVKLEGKYFQTKVNTGDKVKKGEVLVEADIESIRKAGYDCITPMVICNTQDFTSVTGKTGMHVLPGDDCIEIEK
jgi:PTS system beta-glucosides-specific IIC component